MRLRSWKELAAEERRNEASGCRGAGSSTFLALQ